MSKRLKASKDKPLLTFIHVIVSLESLVIDNLASLRRKLSFDEQHNSSSVEKQMVHFPFFKRFEPRRKSIIFMFLELQY